MKSDRTVYGSTALKAVELVRMLGIDPGEAWRRAVREITSSAESQKKHCPRSTFLGLCEEGLVQGIPSGRYTASSSNKNYALKAVRTIAGTSIDGLSAIQLWHLVAGDAVKHNQQMHVVLALFKSGMLNL